MARSRAAASLALRSCWRRRSSAGFLVAAAGEAGFLELEIAEIAFR